MNTPEILLTALLALVIAVMLVRPFVVRRPAARPVRRRKPRPTPRQELYRLSKPAPAAERRRPTTPVRVAAIHRKLPPLHSYGHKKNSEAYSNN